MRRVSLALAATILLIPAVPAAAQPLAGTWVLNNQGTVLTLVLQVDGQGNLGGQLGSNTGAQFTIEGTLQDGVGVGILSGSQGASYFEAHPQDGQLLLALIGVGQDSMPNYNDVQQLLLKTSRPRRAPSDSSRRLPQPNLPRPSLQRRHPLEEEVRGEGPNRPPERWEIPCSASS